MELKCNFVAKDDFKTMPLNYFWAKYLRVYRNINNVAMRTLLPFLAAYMSESDFSALVGVKIKPRNKLDRESKMRYALPSTKPRIKRLVSKKQLHPTLMLVRINFYCCCKNNKN